MKPTKPKQSRGRPSIPVGRQAITTSVSLMPNEWRRFDKLRGKLSRGKFVCAMMDRYESKP